MRGKLSAPWSPWQFRREHYPHIKIYEDDLPGDMLGCTNYTDAIWLTTGLTCAEQRSTLAHELGHLERGPLPAGASEAAQEAEEAIVDQWAAKKLITGPDLARAFAWSRHLAEIAEELWVDLRTVRARLRVATDQEQDAVMEAIARLDLAS